MVLQGRRLLASHDAGEEHVHLMPLAERPRSVERTRDMFTQDDVDAEFLVDLAVGRLLRRLSGLNLPAGQFPPASEFRRLDATGGEHLGTGGSLTNHRDPDDGKGSGGA